MLWTTATFHLSAWIPENNKRWNVPDLHSLHHPFHRLKTSNTCANKMHYVSQTNWINNWLYTTWIYVWIKYATCNEYTMQCAKMYHALRTHISWCIASTNRANNNQSAAVQPTSTTDISTDDLTFLLCITLFLSWCCLPLWLHSYFGMLVASWWLWIIKHWIWRCNWIWAFLSTINEQDMYWSPNLCDGKIDD